MSSAKEPSSPPVDNSTYSKYTALITSDEMPQRTVAGGDGNSEIFTKQGRDPMFQAVLQCQTDEDVDKVFEKLKSIGATNLSHKGVVGETAFHLCFLLMPDADDGSYPDGMSTPLGALAQKLFAFQQGFLDVCYEHELYQGETALHLAIAHRDSDAVRWLLEQGAYLDVYATGSFCKKLEWGEDPFSWAACSQNADILQLLIDEANKRGKDFAIATDTIGNTLLHNMAITSELKDVKKFNQIYNLILEGSKKSCVRCFRMINNQGMTPLQAAASTSAGAYEGIMKAMEVKMWKFAHITCNAHPLKGWDTLHTDPRSDGEVSALEVAVIHENHEFFSMDLNRLLIEFKWKRFAAMHLMKHYLFYFTVVLMGTATACDSEHSYRSALTVRIVSMCISFTYVCRRLFVANRIRRSAFFQKVRFGGKLYLVKAHQSMACLSLFIGTACRVYWDWKSPGPIPHEQAETLVVWIYRSLLPIGVITSWAACMEVLLLDKYLGGVILVVQEIITRDLVVWGMIQGILLVSFSVVLNFIYHGQLQHGVEVVDDFASLSATILSLMFAPVGHLVKMSALRETEHDTLVISLYFGYLIASCVLTFNLTIALFTQRMSTVMESFEGRYQHMWSWIMIAVEKEINPDKVKEKRLGAPISDDDPNFYLVLERNTMKIPVEKGGQMQSSRMSTMMMG